MADESLLALARSLLEILQPVPLLKNQIKSSYNIRMIQLKDMVANKSVILLYVHI